jgi:opacity protein-like surface antigen
MNIWVANLLILVASLVPAMSAYAQADADLVEKVVNGSPWRGTVTGHDIQAEVEFRFSKDQRGRLQGNLEATTAPPGARASTGPVKWLEVKRGKVTFQTPVGADYELAIDQRGHLVGSATLGPNPPTKVDLAPSR